MPFARPTAYSFTPVSVRQNAPAMGGVYGLSNSQGWIFIAAVDDIRTALFHHLGQRHTFPEFRAATGFSFEVCDAATRPQRCRRLIDELHPMIRNRAQ